LDALPTRYLVAVGDVLFRSRGDRNTATALDDRFTEPSVAVLPLIVLRPNLRLVVPEYLAWALNQPAAQRHFAAAARGTSIRMVPKSSLDDLQLDVPGLDTQRRIVAIAALAAHETKLLHQLAKTKTDLTNRLLAECARQMPPTATPIRIKT
jgi:restriction endonuclease S subunit